MNTEEEMSQNDNMNSKNENESYENMSDLNNTSNFNCLHVLIAFIINLSLVAIVIIEFIIKKSSTIFNYLVDIFILFVFIFVITYFITKRDNYLKGFVYYPIVSLFWAIADLLSIFYLEDSKGLEEGGILKVVKTSLITLSLFINVSYLKFCSK